MQIIRKTQHTQRLRVEQGKLKIAMHAPSRVAARKEETVAVNAYTANENDVSHHLHLRDNFHFGPLTTFPDHLLAIGRR
jgi:hypothetical protein